jgi:hypothetical protein
VREKQRQQVGFITELLTGVDLELRSCEQKLFAAF